MHFRLDVKMYFHKNLKFRWSYCLHGCFLCFGVAAILKLIITILDFFLKALMNCRAFTDPVCNMVIET